ncbi:hypothetical protein [Bradyrhizobium genosp. P]|uniref:hypothetical protein n=1 Tax=Bradyrhizobium genosp. P TaxID=83641 RepID=UPI003CF3C0A3
MPMISERSFQLNEPSEDFDQAALDELAASGRNGRVGQVLLSETDRVRVWLINLQPGERLPFHRHVLDYFWTAVTPGAVDPDTVTARFASLSTRAERRVT